MKNCRFAGIVASCWAVCLLSASGQSAPRMNEAPRYVPALPQSRVTLQPQPLAQAGFSVDPEPSRNSPESSTRPCIWPRRTPPSAGRATARNGVAGTTSQAFRDAGTLRINYFRAMAGIPSNIVFSDTFNSKDQQAALMVSANNQLNHHPPSSWKVHTPAGAEAASNSNLFLGSFGPTGISGYIEDYGYGNYSAGHRRWILYPNTGTMGTGDVPVSGTYNSANALWVVVPNASMVRPATRQAFVSWPPPGYTPYSLVFPRWSFSYPNGDFSNATVTMTRNGANVPVSIDSRQDNGYGENTLVWVPDNLNPGIQQPQQSPPTTEATTTVNVSNFLVGGVSQSFT